MSSVASTCFLILPIAYFCLSSCFDDLNIYDGLSLPSSTSRLKPLGEETVEANSKYLISLVQEYIQMYKSNLYIIPRHMLDKMDTVSNMDPNKELSEDDEELLKEVTEYIHDNDPDHQDTALKY